MKAKTNAGFTLIEALIAASLLSLTLGSFAVMTYRATGARKQTENNYQLETRILNALDEIRRDLRRTGYITQTGDYPAVFEPGEIGEEYPGFENPTINTHTDGNPTSRDMVFLLPEDADGDGWPDYGLDGNPAWSPIDHAYVLVPDPHGTNTLQRIDSSGRRRDVAHGVTRAIFDTSQSAGFSIPLDCVRVQLEIAHQEGGRIQKSIAREIIVRLRNGES